ncbi:MAG: tetratricopeptide repeat protein [Acidobacteria bacterium]|nr:tetratricopeptide repeat protein [Acidobacteriota bacterium]
MIKRFLLLLLLLGLTLPALAQAPAESQRAQAYYHFSRARLLDDQGQWEEAIKAYNEALKYDANNSLIYSEMAQTYANHRRIREAVEMARRAIQLDNNNIEAHKLLSQIYIQRITNANAQQPPSTEDVNEAIREFEEIVRIDPSERTAYLMLGRLYYQIKGDRAKATDIYRKFLGIEPGSEEGVISLAKLQLDAGNTKEAIQLLENFLEQAPDSGSGLEALGEAYAEMENFEKAADAYKRALVLDPDNVEIKKSLAQALFFSDKIDDAANLYNELLRAEPDDGIALLRLGQIYRRQQKYSQARQFLTKAVQAFPDSMEVQFNLVLLDRDEGLLQDALRRTADMLKKMERPNGRYSESERQNRRVFLMHLGQLHQTVQNYDEAVRVFTELKSLTPEKDGRIDALIIDVYRDAKNLDRAVAHTETALQEAPDSPELQMIRADLIAEKGRVPEGIEALQKLMKGTDEDLRVLSLMVHVYERAKKFNDAQTVMDTAMKRFPNNHHVYFLQGALYEQQKKYPDAERAFRKSLELEKENPAVLNYLGYMLADRGEKLQEAEGMIKKAVETDPTSGAYLDSLGWVYFRLNKFDLAEQYLKKAIIFAATDSTIHDHLGDVYYKTQRYELARAAWTKSMELATDQEEIQKVKKKLDEVRTRLARK